MAYGPMGGSNMPSTIIVLHGMFNPSQVNLENDPEFFNDIEADVEQECRKYGNVVKVWPDQQSSRGDVWVRFNDVNSSSSCQRALDRRWFAGQQIIAEFTTEAAWAAKKKKGEDDDEADPKKWLGKYSDPNHPGCPRNIEFGESFKDEFDHTIKTLIISGADGEPGCQGGEKQTPFEVKGIVRGETRVLIDFSSKGGPSKVLANYKSSSIIFPDGNKWKKI